MNTGSGGKAMMVRSLLRILLCLTGPVGAAVAQPALAIKGYEIGQPMTECAGVPTPPADADGTTLCDFGPSTLANEPVASVGVVFAEGRVVRVLVALTDDRHSHSAIQAALVEKYGPPQIERPIIRRTEWRRPGQSLTVDGLRRYVALLDTLDYAQRMRSTSKRNAGDL